MKLPQIVDAEDVGIIAKGTILLGLLVAVVLVLAATAGAAVQVFRAVGGLWMWLF